MPYTSYLNSLYKRLNLCNPINNGSSASDILARIVFVVDVNQKSNYLLHDMRRIET